MGMIKGVPVILITKTKIGVDDFNAPVFQDREEVVENVLITPVSSTEVMDSTDLTGNRTTYALAIPKGDMHTWTGQKVKFFGQVWSVIGAPTQGIEHLIPLGWNKKVTVVRYE